MHFDLRTLPEDTIHRLLLHTVIPRPIAWVLTDSGNATFNLAPFSFFNAVSSEPPLLMISVGKKPDGSRKDTWRNIEERGDFVVHLTEASLGREVSTTSAALPHGVSELEHAGLATVPFEGFRLPRLERAKAAFACRRHLILELGAEPQGVIFGEVQALWLADEVVTMRGDIPRVDPRRLDPLARLGGSDYSLLGEIRTIERPR